MECVLEPGYTALNPMDYHLWSVLFIAFLVSVNVICLTSFSIIWSEDFLSSVSDRMISQNLILKRWK